MCGIAGVMYFEDRKPSREMLKSMTDCIAHRGPDDVGFWSESRIGLGFRRLSIIDLRDGHQPLSNEDGTVWIAFNGEIYNYKYLRDVLQQLGHQFKTQTDTEVIVHLYEQYGEECVRYLRGMFSFVIWDRNKQQLFGARDHFGIKPFYFHRTDKQFVFGSEIKSILTVEGVSKEIHAESLLNYLTFQYVPEPATMFKNIFKLPPAHTIRLNRDGQMQIRRYWDPMFEPEERPLEEYVEQIREGLRDSVIDHMQSDVERGCFLSSGIDSTAIAALMRDTEQIRTFSVGFEGPNNETIISAQTAAELDTIHHAHIITPDQFFDAVSMAVWHQDEPVADPSAIALYFVANIAREHVKVVLSGEGADELFGGYRIYNEPNSVRALQMLPSPMQWMLRMFAHLLPQGMYGKNYLLRGTIPLEKRYLGNAKIMDEDQKRRLVNVTEPPFTGYRSPFDIASTFYHKSEHLDPITRMQYIDMNLWLPGDILMKADKMTMANSLELRVPFLDVELFQIARRIPAKYRLAEGTTKYVFRRAMEGIVPNSVLKRPKLGFPVPLRDWLKGKKGQMMYDQIEASGIGEFVNLVEVKRMLTMHQHGAGDYSRHLWTIYIFAIWYLMFISELATGKSEDGSPATLAGKAQAQAQDMAYRKTDDSKDSHKAKDKSTKGA